MSPRLHRFSHFDQRHARARSRESIGGKSARGSASHDRDVKPRARFRNHDLGLFLTSADFEVEVEPDGTTFTRVERSTDDRDRLPAGSA